MNVVVAQLDLVWHDRAANHAKARALLQSKPPAPGSLIILPEAFPVGFSMDVNAISPGAESTEAFIAELAKAHASTVIGGNIIKPDDRGRNVALVAMPDGKIAHRYEKLHPFSFAKEDQHYKPGQSFVSFDCGGVKVAPFICYDLRFPEIFRMSSRTGTEAFVVIANWPTARVHHWVSLLVARAIENQAYVIGCNRCGRDPNVPYPGRSIIVDPRGQIVVDAGDSEGVYAATIDIDALRTYRREFPALKDMRFVPDSLA